MVHAPVVLLPLAFLAALALAARPSWRRQASIFLAGTTLVVLVATVIAVQSGQTFAAGFDERDLLPDITKHESLANTTQLFALVFFLASAGVAAADWRSSRNQGPSWLVRATPVLMGLAVVAGGLGTLWMIRTGHEGARLNWSWFFAAAVPWA